MNISAKSFHDILSKYPNIKLIIGTGPLIRESLEMNGTRIDQVSTKNDRRIWKA
jgi:hypothetical protein